MSRSHPKLSRRSSHDGVRDSRFHDPHESQRLCQNYISRRLAPLALADNPPSGRPSVAAAYSSYSRRTSSLASNGSESTLADEGIGTGAGGRCLSRCSTSSGGSRDSWGVSTPASTTSQSTRPQAVNRQKRRLTSPMVDEIVERVSKLPHSSASLANVVRRITTSHDDNVADSIRIHEQLVGDGCELDPAEPARPLRPSAVWRSADLQVVEALQEFFSLKAGLFNSPEHQPRPGPAANATVTYEIVQTDFKQNRYVAFATLPGGSCYGSLQVCPTRGEARRSAACVALVHAAWNELPSKILNDSNIDGLVQIAQTSKSKRPSRCSSATSVFSNPPSLEGSCSATPTHYRSRTSLHKQASISSDCSVASIDSGCCSGSGATTPMTPCLDTLSEESRFESALQGHDSQSWQAVDILSQLLKMYRGKTAMDFRSRMTVFQLMQWSGDLQRAKSKGLAFEPVLQAYLATPLDDKLRSYLAKMWARREASERGAITQALKNVRRELDILRVNGSELSFVKEKKGILINAFAHYQRQQAAVRQDDVQVQSPARYQAAARGRRPALSRQSSGLDWYTGYSAN